MSAVNVICLKWGKLYSPMFVNRLYRGVKSHLHRPFRFVCFTDDPTGLDEGIEAQPLPERPPEYVATPRYGDAWPNIYVKLALYRPGLANLKGPTLFLDIDQIVTGDLDCFFDYQPGEFCIVHNWMEFRKRLFRKLPFVGNSSCFRFEAGGPFDYVYNNWIKEMAASMDTKLYSTEQAYMTHAILAGGKVNWWPSDWVTSFKRSCTWFWPLNHILPPRLPKATRILCFHGHPNPDEAIVGFKGSKHINGWTLPAPWVKDLWEVND